MTASRPLGDYLRARRELVLPEEAGIPVAVGRRRVAGLRRSEVAMLAGISTEYYVKLEQGREVHPTQQVLDALARALQLDATARSYLASLVQLPRHDTERRRDLPVLGWMLDGWPNTAAILHDRFLDIVASNALMCELVPAFRVGANSLTAMLLDPVVREIYGEEWEGLTARSVALLRTMTGPPPHLVRAQQLIAQLTRESERFREVWPRNDVHGASDGVHRITHPRLGPLALRFMRLNLAGPGDYSLFLYFAEPGTPTDAALRQLSAELAEG